VLQNCFRGADGFRLQEVLKTAEPLRRRRDSVIYAGARMAETNMDALSISQCRWSGVRGHAPGGFMIFVSK
jgi:hypothetical protein